MDHQDVRVFRLEAAQVEGRKRAAGGEQSGPRNLVARKRVDALRQTKLIQNFKRRGVHRVAPKFAVEIVMHLQQRGGHTSPRQQEGKHGSGRSASNDAATLRPLLVWVRHKESVYHNRWGTVVFESGYFRCNDISQAFNTARSADSICARFLEGSPRTFEQTRG